MAVEMIGTSGIRMSAAAAAAAAAARTLLPRVQRKGMAGMAAPPKKELSKHIGFYKEFGRPLSKVFLMSFFTYQACYWLWLKLEKEESMRGKEEEVKGLMAEVERLKAAAAEGKK